MCEYCILVQMNHVMYDQYICFVFDKKSKSSKMRHVISDLYSKLSDIGENKLRLTDKNDLIICFEFQL